MPAPTASGTPLGVFVGLCTLDVVHRVDRVAGVNEKVTAHRQDIAAGGPAANAAVTFAALGGRALLITSLGSDPLARLIGDELGASGVRVFDVTPDGTDAPAVSAIAVSESTGARSVTSIDATARTVHPPEDLQGLLDGAAVVLLDGHHPALARAALRAAGRLGIPVVVDAGRWKPVMADLLPPAAHVVCSADFRWPGSATAQDSALAIRSAAVAPPAPPTDGGQVVAVTRGAQPVLWWQGDASGQVPVPAVRAVDTLGAGDAFHGAYAHLVTDRTLTTPERLAGAAQVAALRVSVVGPRAWLPLLPGAGAPDPTTTQDQRG
ncbi:PfkB family carbohydrate kinase [Nakamurella sp. GG22]